MAKKGGSKDEKKFDEDMERRRRLSKMRVYDEPEKAPADTSYRMREAAYQQEIAELKLRLKNMKGANTEEELRQRVEELNNIKDAYAKKMKNTVALQRLKYEKLIEKIKRDLDAYHRVMNAAEKESGPKEEIADYDKLAPEEKLSKLTEFADELYLHRAGMLYKQWHADMAGKMSLTGVVGLCSVSVDRFEEKTAAHLKALREKEDAFRAEMNSGCPDIALDAYFSEFMVKMLAGIAENVQTASISTFENRMLVRKDELKEKRMDAFTIRNAFMYEIDRLADEARKKKQPVP